MRAVLWDMDGTLVDSEKLWDLGIQELYRRHDRELPAEVRTATVGGSAETVMDIVYADLGLNPDPDHMAQTADWLHEYVGELFATGLPWCAGAKEMLDQLLAADIPMGLVTNTRRDLTEKALDSIGRHYFSVSVCADEVPSGKPAPDPYLRAAQLLGLNPADCLAIEDSLIGSEAAVLAGCAVLVIPNDIEVPTSARRRRVDTLDQLTPADLRAVHTEIGDLTERSA
ncbi:HAD family hydrolase [Mycolicibacterium confluentis]|uniref:Phosphoglycolate phosphatase n=1 Tax=Mycolicibacterium confluentis TaxID=28047 RepID=A0A7I7XVC8_9MYCO|nr:HAD family phosphatase [Mycolicibacterium confluentis]MCV7317892.1 HAD family phosphatase [Mycolicibacterium confluentis]ORV22913.1 HAD family hydrolase [Mycolicibacterium confluentis]BBZ33250.1 phosphoglycolate phosphatase [Mycolicibacterium confluentis]